MAMRVGIPTPMLMPSGRSLTTVLNREPGCAGTVGSNVPSPCKVPDLLVIDAGARPADQGAIRVLANLRHCLLRKATGRAP